MTRSVSQAQNPWLNLGVNVVLPAVMMMKGKGWLEGFWGGTSDELTIVVFVLALSFPLLYGAYDLAARRQWNFFSILGLVGVGLTGGIGLLKLPAEWIAVKEAGIPGLIGIAVLISHYTGRPLINVFLLRPEFFDIDLVVRRLRARNAQPAFERVVRRSNLLFAVSFFLSSVLNYALAKTVVVSPAGTDAFNAEIGRMTLLSYPVIALPTMLVTAFALWLLFASIERLAGIETEELMVSAKRRRERPE